MQNIQILVVGRQPEIMETILRLLNNQPGWRAIGSTTPDEAISVFKGGDIDLVLVGAGLSAYDTGMLLKTCNQQKPDVPVIQHYGGGSGLLYAEIHQALNK